VLHGYQSAKDYPQSFRGIRFKDPETGKRSLFITNNTALSICALNKARCHVELFFRWVKMDLRIKSFFGTSENAVKAQIWIVVSVYVLIAITKKRLNLFEKTPLGTALSSITSATESAPRRRTVDSLQLTLGQA
jgi:hypothetical protein